MSTNHKAPTTRKQFESLMRNVGNPKITTPPVEYARKALAESRRQGRVTEALSWLTPADCRAEVDEMFMPSNMTGRQLAEAVESHVPESKGSGLHSPFWT